MCRLAGPPADGRKHLSSGSSSPAALRLKGLRPARRALLHLLGEAIVMLGQLDQRLTSDGVGEIFRHGARFLCLRSPPLDFAEETAGGPAPRGNRPFSQPRNPLHPLGPVKQLLAILGERIMGLVVPCLLGEAETSCGLLPQPQRAMVIGAAHSVSITPTPLVRSVAKLWLYLRPNTPPDKPRRYDKGAAMPLRDPRSSATAASCQSRPSLAERKHRPFNREPGAAQN